MARRSYASLSSELRTQLEAVEPSTDFGVINYRPCCVTLATGETRDFVYLVEARTYYQIWGVWPEDDPGKKELPLGRISAIHDSPARLPAALANKLYAAGESGMGYFVFTVVLRDGRQLAFVPGNAVDFPSLPHGVTSSDIVDVLPGTGWAEGLRDRPPLPSESAADYLWCLYGE